MKTSKLKALAFMVAALVIAATTQAQEQSRGLYTVEQSIGFATLDGHVGARMDIGAGREVCKHLDVVAGLSMAIAYGGDVTYSAPLVFTPAVQFAGLSLGLRLKTTIGSRLAVSATTTVGAMVCGHYKLTPSNMPTDVVILDFPIEERLAVNYLLSQRLRLGAYYGYTYFGASLALHSAGLTLGIAL